MLFEQRRAKVRDADHNEHHQHHGEGQRQRDLPTVVDHDGKGHDRLDGGGNDGRKAVVDQVVDAGNVAGEAAHDLAGLVPVKIADGEILQMVEQVAPQGLHGVHRDMQHELGIDDRHGGGKQVGDRHHHDIADDDRHGGMVIHVAFDDHLFERVVDRLHQQGGNRADAGGEHDADRNDDESALMHRDIGDQTLGRLFDILRFVLFFLFLFFEFFFRQLFFPAFMAGFRSSVLPACLFGGRVRHGFVFHGRFGDGFVDDGRFGDGFVDDGGRVLFFDGRVLFTHCANTPSC